MSVSEHPPVAGVPAAQPSAVPAVVPVTAPAWPTPQWSPPPPRHPEGIAGKVLAVVFAVAWLACPMVEPVPVGDVHYPLWQLPIDLATVGTIVVAVGALWRGSPRAPRYGIAAGVMMAVMTMVCPLAGHTPTGWWTWVQAAMSLFVLLTSAALPRLGLPGRLPR